MRIANSNSNKVECSLRAKTCSMHFTYIYSFTFATILKVRCYNHLHFINEETKVQGVAMIT